MTFQAHEGHGARSEDLHRHILRSHLAYLNQEETPAKLEHRHNLESLISKFLSVVSHTVKFTYLEVADILNSSIENNPHFSAYKAGSAFEALEKYATNLISHPWRKEYKTVKLYSGFYKHSVENQILRGSSIFRLLGYKFKEDGVLFLDEPIDPDKAARVALDCLTSSVECQIMVQIYERVKSYKCSWEEIHGVRQDYVCGIDEAVRILHQLKRNAADNDEHDRWLRNQENGFMREEKPVSKMENPKTGILVDVSNTWPGYSEGPLAMSASVYSKPNKGTHSKLPSWSESIAPSIRSYQGRNFTETNNSYATHHFDDHLPVGSHYYDKNPRFVSKDLTPESWKDPWDVLSPLESQNDISYNHSRTGYNAVPNVKDAFTSHFGPMYPPMMGIPPYPHDVPPRPCQCRMCCEQQLSKYHTSMSHRCDGRHPVDDCSSFLKLSLDDQYNSSGDAFKSMNRVKQNSSKRGSYYDNVPSTFENDSLNAAGQSLSNKCDFQSNGTTVATKKKNYVASEPLKSVVTRGMKKWSCISCTYYNAGEKSICDMCGRSKLPGPEVTPLVSGGRECPQCTLVNKKDCEDCTACGASLKDSPTYI